MPEKGIASYYDNKSVDPRWGGYTKSGEKFDETKLTVAVRPSEWKRLRGRILRITNPKNRRWVRAKVNDTGNMEKYGRHLDLSKEAFRRIADPDKGVIEVEWEVEDGEVAKILERKKNGINKK